MFSPSINRVMTKQRIGLLAVEHLQRKSKTVRLYRLYHAIMPSMNIVGQQINVKKVVKGGD
jgi:hypothetical protein